MTSTKDSKIKQAQDWQLRLRGAWRHNDVRLFVQGKEVSVQVATVGKAVIIRVKDIFAYMSFLLARDLDRLRICQKPDCCTPFFVAGRSDQRSCSEKCRFTMSKRNLRKGRSHYNDKARKVAKRRLR